MASRACYVWPKSIEDMLKRSYDDRMARKRSPARSPKGESVCGDNVVHLDALRRVRAATPPGEVVSSVATLFSVLCNETRLRILRALSVDELCVCDFAQAVSQSVSATSHQLRSLRHLGLVQHRSEGKLVFYRLSSDHVMNIIDQAREAIA